MDDTEEDVSLKQIDEDGKYYPTLAEWLFPAIANFNLLHNHFALANSSPIGDAQAPSRREPSN